MILHKQVIITLPNSQPQTFDMMMGERSYMNADGDMKWGYLAINLPPSYGYLTTETYSDGDTFNQYHDADEIMEQIIYAAIEGQMTKDKWDDGLQFEFINPMNT